MVDLETWCETLRKNPLRYRFDGLDGFYTDVREAAVHDERFMERHIEREQQHVVDNIHEYREEYIDFLARKVDLLHCHDNMVAMCRNLQYTEYEMQELEEEVGDLRHEFAWDRPDWEWERECIRDDDPSYWLAKHPPVEVWNEAYSYGFPVTNVVYLCPSCRRQAMTIDELRDNGFHHYCSLCDSEYRKPHDFRQAHDLATFCDDLGVDPWPFGRPDLVEKGAEVVLLARNNYEGVVEEVLGSGRYRISYTDDGEERTDEFGDKDFLVYGEIGYAK